MWTAILGVLAFYALLRSWRLIAIVAIVAYVLAG
jgi:hypothetical protein